MSILQRGLWRYLAVASSTRQLLQSQARRTIFLAGPRLKAVSNSEHHSPSTHNKGDHHGAAHSDGHEKKDPYETWYEFPPSIEVPRHARLKIPWYIGRVPSASYREPPRNDFWFQRFAAYVLALVLWWWISWNWFMDPGHVTGEYRWPNRYQWSDAELGIPPLDA